MGKTYNVIINRFNGGMSEDKRVQDFSKFSLTKHSDAFTYPHKLVPHVKTEPALGFYDFDEMDIANFVYAPYGSGTGFQLYGYGKTRGANVYPKVWSLDIDAGTLDDTLWGEPEKGEANTGLREEEVFFYYKGFIYMWASGKLMRYDTLSGSGGQVDFNNAYQTIAFTTVAQPIHHPADDCAYFFADNNVHRLNGTVFDAGGTTPVLVLPTNLRIVAACAYGNFLAIGCVTLGIADARSIVYLWDRDSSLVTVTEKIDFGSGTLRHLANLNNKLIGIVNFYTDSAYSLNKGSVVIRQGSGNFATTLNVLTTDSTVSANISLPKSRIVKDNKLYFPMELTLNGDARRGIWVVDENGKATLAVEQEGALSIQAVCVTGNIWWIVHNGDGTISRSDDDGVYSTTLPSVYESLIIGGDPATQKKLVGVTVSTEPLPSAGQVVLKYRMNEETSWTTIFTNAVDNSIKHSAVNIESSGVALPTFRELQLRVESTGGAVITGIKARYEDLEDDIY